MEEFIVSGKDLSSDERTAKHEDWVNGFIGNYNNITTENVDSAIRDEVGKVFVKVLEHAGVYKCTKEGREAFRRFTESVK